MASPQVLQQIFGRGGQMDSQPADSRQRLIAMLSGIGSGMSQASMQPGAGFGQALAAGAQGMVQGRDQANQAIANQFTLDQARSKAEMDRERRQQLMELLGAGQANAGPGFASQVDARLPGALPPGQVAPGQPLAPSPGPMQAQAIPPTDPGRGQLAGMFESGNDPTAVSTGAADPGGASYGRYQLSSQAGTLGEFFNSPEGQPFRMQFGDLQPGSPGFNEIWQQVASDPRVGAEFDQAQKQFMERTHFQPALDRAQKAGLPVDNPGIREAVLSIGTQHSPEGGLQIMNEAMARIPQNASPQQIVEALYGARSNYVSNLGNLPASTKEAVLNRYRQEAGLAARLAGAGQQAGPQVIPTPSGGPGAPQTQPQQLNGYQQRAAQTRAQPQQAGGATGIPPELRQLLGMMEPEQAAKALFEYQTAQQDAGGFTTANQTTVQKAQLFKQADPSLSDSEAMNLALGRHVVSRDPISGQAQIVDKASGQVLGNASQGAVQAYEEPPKQSIIPEELDITEATGGSGWWGKLVNRAKDVVGMPLSEGDVQVERGIQALNNLSIQTEVALAQEVGGRPSNYLLERLRTLTIEPAKLFQGDQMSRERLRATVGLIDQKLDVVNDVVNNPDQYRPTEVSEARRNKTQLEHLKEQYDVALSSFEENTPQTQGGILPGSQGTPAPAVGYSPEEQEIIDRWTN